MSPIAQIISACGVVILGISAEARRWYKLLHKEEEEED
ncbi:hypothetical protein SEA_FINKLE_39 [Gordonia phage Finkle]|uniref:Uncharacterized protein n=1 Tax=Gordonia phage Finkle TaxID=2926099 RepID=A0A9E7NJH1_9CAUD|nr:hypothetical protein QEH33_gp39 [Gordonia phage Finkle]UTN92956.1 hypothetical protein SEA_FINKLE_39 [Gordonia phage Finkle]